MKYSEYLSCKLHGMKTYKVLLYLSLLATTITNTSYAQRNFGVANSDWSSMNSLFINPASIAGSHEKITISLFSVNVGVDNNYGTFSSIGNLGSAFNSTDSGGNSLFHNSGRQTFSMMVPSAEIRGPGILIKINDRQSIALTTRIRIMNQLSNFDQSLFNLITNPTIVPNADNKVSAQNFNWTAHIWTELGVTYAVSLIADKNSELKAGITLRYLGGVGYLALKGKNLDVDYQSGKDSFYASNSDLQYTSNIVSTRSAVFNGINASTLFGNFFGSSQGSGIGADLGVVYAFSPKGKDTYSDEPTSGNSYKIKLSASITDIGAINYNAKNNSTVNVTGNGYITGKGLGDNAKNATDFKNYIIGQGFNADTMSASTKLYLPTAMVVGIDYKVYKKFFLNATYVANLANAQNFGNTYYNQVTITPRYDSKIFTVGMPITYSMLANDMKVGLGLRVAGFFIGSDDMLALFSNNQYGFGFYAGAYIPLYKKEKETQY